MTDRRDVPDPHPDSPPETDFDRDPRSDIERAVDTSGDAIGEGEGSHRPAPLDGPSSDAGENGAGGVVKNQDDLQQ